MELWPIDNKVVSIKDKQIKPANRKVSSAGYQMSFSKGTVLKTALVLKMAYLSFAEKNTIRVFFNENQGTAFSMNHPDPNNGSVLTVIFDQDELEFTYTRVFPGEYTLELNLREV